MDHLADAVGVSLERIFSIARHPDRYYRILTIPKRDGTLRKLERPTGPLKFLQRQIQSRFLGRQPMSAIAYGGVKGKSHFSGAAPHAGRRFVANLDFRECFPHVTASHVYAMFMRMGCSPNVARVLTQLVTIRGHIPQGAPASTTITNLVLQDIDAVLAARASALHLDVTRFVDDLTASGEDRRTIESFINAAVSAIRVDGFKIKRSKTSVTGRHNPQIVTGLSVNNGVHVPKTYRRKLRDRVRAASHRGWIDAAERRSLEGKLAYLRRSNAGASAAIKATLEEIPVSDERC